MFFLMIAYLASLFLVACKRGAEQDREVIADPRGWPAASPGKVAPVMNEPGSALRRIARTWGRAAPACRANRDDLDPAIRLVGDLAALAVLIRRRVPAPAATSLRGACR
jgi:hypothetical protein